MRKRLYPGIFSLAFIVFVIGSYVIVAQTAITGEWTASTKSEGSGKINLSFNRHREDGGKSQHGSTFEFSDLQGLTPEQAHSGKVSFRLVREAGTIECEGTFVNGRGSGTFRFVPDMNFVTAMSNRGFDFDKPSTKGGGSDVEDRLFAATTIGITTKLADDLRSADFGPLGVDDLFKAAIFKITPQFMSEMKATGFPNLGMEDLVKARIFKIDPEYVRQVHQMGYDKQNFEGLVKFRIFKVTPELLSMLKTEGYGGLSSEEVVKFRIFNIDQEFIRRAKSENPNASVEDLVRMKIGVGR